MLKDYGTENKNIALWDSNKVGTLIVGYFRCGTHFLHDVIVNQYPNLTNAHHEICTDNTITQLEQLTDNTNIYNVAILNNCDPKFYLASRPDILSKWHVINLIRNNKIEHFISHWFWAQNTGEERLKGTGKFKHNNTNEQIYRQSLADIKQSISVKKVIQWLQEQLINRYIKCDLTVEYNNLPMLSTDIKWTPNHYGNIQLEDLFVNAEEIKKLLLNFDLTSANNL
jgi:hypothetical protein